MLIANLGVLFWAAAELTQAAPAKQGSAQSTTRWWKEGVVYQVYPASFKENRTENAIGWGDVKGITSKLGHIEDLGAEIVWLSPFYASPLLDMGYDVSNYDTVNPHFGGSLVDIKEFIYEVHRRGMRCIFDLVINHTSDQHRWFVESRSSKSNAYRNWYHWSAPQFAPNGTMRPPNNWPSMVSGSAWTYDNITNEYYLHNYNSYQPALNWANPVARKGIYDSALNFWLELGVDGFRMDAFNFYSKPSSFADVPANESDSGSAQEIFEDGPREHEYLHEMNEKCLSSRDTFTVGEYGASDNLTSLQEYVSASRQEVNTMFLVNMAAVGRNGTQGYTLNMTEYRNAVNFTQALGDPRNGDGWNTIYLENHDLPRSVSRLDDSPEYRTAVGKVLSMFLSTLSGTLFLYQGQEIGLINVPTNWTIDDFQDGIAHTYYDNQAKAGANLTQALLNLQATGRDNSRYPYNWDRTGGFSVNESSWTKHANLDINLADQIEDDNSVYNFWRRMIRTRRQHKNVFVYGEFDLLDLQDNDFLVYHKTHGAQQAMIVLNLSKNTRSSPVPVPSDAVLLMSTNANITRDQFGAYEGRVYLV